MAFAWHTQYAHWMLEHLPRMWYYLQLCRLLPQPPVLITPRGLAPWQRMVLRMLPTLGTPSHSPPQLLPLDPPASDAVPAAASARAAAAARRFFEFSFFLPCRRLISDADRSCAATSMHESSA